MSKGLMAKIFYPALACSLSVSVFAIADTPAVLDVPAGELVAALKALGRQVDIEFLYQPEQLKNIHTDGVKGTYSAQDAIAILLKGTPLHVYTTASGAMVIAPQPSGRVSQPTTSSGMTAPSEGSHIRLATLEEYAVQTRGVPEILISGSRSLNADIERTRDEVQPYIVFNRDTLARSGATNLEEFFRNKLTANTTSYMNSQAATSSSRSSINLRGLGASQTLILIDGRRVGGAVRNGTPQQPDFNAIPLAAIERIEILPATASGIYGGGATGGVVNIVLRHNYRGVEVNLSYDNSFDTDSSIRRADILGGFALEDGKTRFSLAASHLDGNPLRAGDRDFLARSRAARLANNPTPFLSIPPIGATTNIRSVNGSPLFGPGTSNITSVPVGYAGGGGLAPLQANAGSYNLDPADSAQSDGGAEQSLINAPKTGSITVTVRREFTPQIEAFVDAGRSTNEGVFDYDVSTQISTSQNFLVPARAPTNPFGQDVSVRFPNRLRGEDTAHSADTESRAVGGVLFSLPGRWRGEVDYTWDRTHSSYTGPSRIDLTAVNAALANGTLDPFRDTTRFPLNLSPYSVGPQLSESNTTSTLENSMIRLSGPVLSLPGGDLVVSSLLEHRAEDFGEGRSVASSTSVSASFLQPERSQSIDSAYLEVTTPIVSERNARPGIRGLDLQLAGRYDKYVLHGARSETIITPTTPIVRTRSEATSTNPTAGLKYQPVQDVTLRVSYGTGFLPPAVNQLAANAPTVAGGFTDPLRGNARVSGFDVISGGNPNLTPEKSKSRSAGIILTPRFVSGLRLSADYVWTHKTDNIAGHPLGVQGIINDAALLPGRVVRDTDPSAFGSFGVGPIKSVDGTLLNIAEAKYEAYDVQLDYSLSTSNLGGFDFSLMGTRQIHAQTRLIMSSPLVENVGLTYNNPSKYKANSAITWSARGWTAGWNSRYISSYTVSTAAATIQNQGGPTVPSQIYHDVFVKYRFADLTGGVVNSALANLEVKLGVTNVLNKEPPYDAFASNVYYSLYGDPRLATYQLSLSKAF